MSKLWVYGCSFAAGNGVLGTEKDNPEHCFGKWCADDLGMDFNLRARSSTSNWFAFETLLSDISKMEKDDIVVVMWTYPDRTKFGDQHLLATGSSSENKYYFENLYSEERSKVENTGLILAANKLCNGNGIRIINTTFFQTQVKGRAWFYNRKLLSENGIKFPECMLYETIYNRNTYTCYDGYHPSLDTHKEYGVRLAQYIREKYEQD